MKLSSYITRTPRATGQQVLRVVEVEIDVVVVDVQGGEGAVRGRIDSRNQTPPQTRQLLPIHLQLQLP